MFFRMLRALACTAVCLAPLWAGAADLRDYDIPAGLPMDLAVLIWARQSGEQFAALNTLRLDNKFSARVHGRMTSLTALNRLVQNHCLIGMLVPPRYRQYTVTYAPSCTRRYMGGRWMCVPSDPNAGGWPNCT